MIGARVIGGLGLGAIVAAGIAVSPAVGAADQGARRPVARSMTLGAFGGIGTFTPASADPRVAAALAKSGLTDEGFRFTPSEATRDGGRAVAIAVQSRSNRVRQSPEQVATDARDSGVGLVPVAYNIGVSVGWKRLALSADTTHVDLAGDPASRQTTDVGVSYTGHRLSGRVIASADKPLPGTPRLVAQDPSYSIDVGGSYSLTRRLDVTAGVRYKSERENERLPQFADTQRDSQAVYIGTAFRF